MRDTYQFVKAMVRHLVALMTGPLVATIMFGVDYFTAWTVPKWIVPPALLFGLSLAIYLAWRDEYRNARLLEERNAELGVEVRLLREQLQEVKAAAAAGFSVEIPEAWPGQITDLQGNKTTAAWLVARIRNTGAPSKVGGFWLSIILPGGTRVEGEPRVIRGSVPMTIHADTGDREETMRQEEDFQRTARSKAIGTGDIEFGNLMFAFPTLPLEALGIETVYELVISDAWNKKTRGIYLRSGKPLEPKFYPRLFRDPLPGEDGYEN